MSGQPERPAILEALLFVAEEPLPLSKLQEVLADADVVETEASLRDLALRMETDGRGLMVQEVAGGFRLATRPESAFLGAAASAGQARASEPGGPRDPGDYRLPTTHYSRGGRGDPGCGG